LIDAILRVQHRLSWDVWWSCIASLFIVGLVAAVVVAPIVGRAVGVWSRGKLIRAALRFSLALLLSSLTFRLTAPRGGFWFADLGEYFNPAVTLTSLIFVGLALHLQIATLEAAQRHLSEAQRQLTLSRVPIVLIKELYLRQRQLMLTVECGAEAAINVVVTISAAPGQVIGELKYSALFPGMPVPAVCGETESAPEMLNAFVYWRNVHGAAFEYSATVERSAGDTWIVPTQLDFKTHLTV
jgi:hypothetical protein